MGEIEFQKYRQRGAYHWGQVSANPFRRNAFVLGRYENVLRLVADCFQGRLEEARILDVGCGDGVLAWRLAKRGARVSGIDSSDLAIRLAEEKTRGMEIEFRQGNAYELPWTDESFDAVVSSDVIEHVADAARFLSEIRRVAKKGGWVVISTPIRLTERPLDSQHAVEWFPSEFRGVIEPVFPDSAYHESHPVFWMELIARMPKMAALLNVVSLFANPLGGFRSWFGYMTLQYAVSRKASLP